MVKVRLGCRAKLKCLDDVRKLLSVGNFNAMLEEYELVKFLYELEFFNIQVPTLLWLVTKGELETRNSAPGMKTMVFTIEEAALDKDSISLRKLPYGYVTLEAPELLKDYYVNVINWVDKSTTYVVGEDEEDNMPGYLTLTSAFQKLDRQVEEGFRRLDERIDERMDKIEARVTDLEKKIPYGRKMEFNVVSRLRTIFVHELATFKWKINKELREEFNLQPPNDGPPLIYELHGQKLVDEVLEHHSTMESLNDSMYKGDVRSATNRGMRNTCDDSVGLESVVTASGLLSTISKKDLQILTNQRQWLNDEHINAALHLLNMQGEAYAGSFPDTKWTCLGTSYSGSIEAAHAKFSEDRLRHRGELIWEGMHMDLFLIVSGISEKWQCKTWRACTKVYGTQNLDNMHWVAYEYDFLEKEVKVYDSMTNVFYVKCQKVFEMHTAIVPSLYNIGCEEGDNKMDPDVPFTVKFVSVPQQPNHHDCGVYAIK
ncbi:hypothetical protein LIER_29005 [Lithospermum erythrorhizon]|uniref:Ubiquitin-like protease family profile domain-containing protein n=1 Tax=Lithospermum erythrorhizon TaxID=34254 RepID=A0AAV3RIP6_LITER